MNTLKTIYDKLGDKTELAKHNVDLSLSTDMKKRYDVTLSLAVELERRIEDIIKAESRAREISNSLMKEYTAFNQVETAIKAKFTEIGLDYNKGIYKADNDKLTKRVSDLMQKYNTYQRTR